MEGNREKRRGIFLTLAGGMCWGISGCFGQFLFQEKGYGKLAGVHPSADSRDFAADHRLYPSREKTQ